MFVPLRRDVVVGRDDGADLQEVEDLFLTRLDIEIHGKLHLNGAAHLLLAHRQQVLDYLCQRERAIFKYSIESYQLTTLVEGRFADCVFEHIPRR